MHGIYQPGHIYAFELKMLTCIKGHKQVVERKENFPLSLTLLPNNLASVCRMVLMVRSGTSELRVRHVAEGKAFRKL